MKQAQALAFATVAMTVVLIGVGVLVRATGSGLGCPDWPTCHGGVVPPDNHHAIIESSHRYVAAIVGFMVIGTAIMAWRFYRHVPVTFWSAVAAVPLVGIQGILGAITVVRELPPEVVATHLVTAMVVLGVELVVAWTMWAEDADHRIVGGPALGQPVRQLGLAAVAAVAWLAVVMWVGGYMTESGGATACEGWPLCNGSVVPGNDDQEISHMLHRYLAGLLIVFVAWVSVASSRAKQRVRWSRLAVSVLGLLYVGQVTVGALNVWLTFPDPLTMLHTVIASLIWGTLASIAIVSLYEPRARTVAPGVYTRGEAPA